MRVACLVPAATRILRALDLQHLVVACTHECGLKGVPVVSTARIDVRATSGRIDHAVRLEAREGRPVIVVEAGPLLEARPDVVFVEDLCEVCAVGGGQVRAMADALGARVRIVPLKATSMETALDDIGTVGHALGEDDAAKGLALSTRSKMRSVARRVEGLPRPRVTVVEWLDPPFSAGHWVPEQVALAGGVEVLASTGAASRTIAWEDVVAARPDVVVLAPCGLDLGRVAAEARRLGVAKRLDGTPAAAAGAVYAVDADRYFSCAGPELVDGAALLAGLIHGDSVPGGVKGRDWMTVV